MALGTGSLVKYGTTVIKGIEVPNNNMDGKSATNMSGFAVNGTKAFCVKRNNDAEKATIYTISNFTTSPSITRKEVISCATYGMTQYNNCLYIAALKNNVNKIVKVSSGAVIEKEFATKIDGKEMKCQAISHYQGDEFILMANALNTGNKLCFVIGKFNEATQQFEETKRFYVENKGYATLQDIYYDPVYGLFIVTNEKVDNAYTTANLILLVDLENNTASTYNGKPLYYPSGEFKFDGKTSQYKQLNVESLAIGPNRYMYIAANVVPASSASDGFHTDGMFYIGNYQFGEDHMLKGKIYFNDGVSIPKISDKIGTTPYTCTVPGAFALNGKTGYCLTTHTGDNTLKDDVSVLLKTANIDTTAFTAVNGKTIRGLGHCNALAYYSGALYVGAYNKNTGARNIIKLSLSGEKPTTYTYDRYIGGLSVYENGQFIGLNYESSSGESYAEYPTFYIGRLNDGTKKFEVSKSFYVVNPDYVSKESVLQDIHYDSVFGLYFITRTSGVDHLCRVLPEDIKNAAYGEEVAIAEYHRLNNTVNELESVCISGDTMYAVDNNGSQDKAVKVLTFTFLR